MMTLIASVVLVTLPLTWALRPALRRIEAAGPPDPIPVPTAACLQLWNVQSAIAAPPDAGYHRRASKQIRAARCGEQGGR